MHLRAVLLLTWWTGPLSRIAGNGGWTGPSVARFMQKGQPQSASSRSRGNIQLTNLKFRAFVEWRRQNWAEYGWEIGCGVVVGRSRRRSGFVSSVKEFP
jgi:hypothetical protein